MEKLRIYSSALDLIKKVYLLCAYCNGLSRDFSLQDQIKRADVSVLANIAEGYNQTIK